VMTNIVPPLGINGAGLTCIGQACGADFSESMRQA
jgi:hypothetical protein